MSSQSGFRNYHVMIILSIICFILAFATPIPYSEPDMFNNLGFKIIISLIGTTCGISGTLLYIYEQNKTRKWEFSQCIF